jgi:hypothetical protein
MTSHIEVLTAEPGNSSSKTQLHPETVQHESAAVGGTAPMPEPLTAAARIGDEWCACAARASAAA